MSEINQEINNELENFDVTQWGFKINDFSNEMQIAFSTFLKENELEGELVDYYEQFASYLVSIDPLANGLYKEFIEAEKEAYKIFLEGSSKFTNQEIEDFLKV